MVGRALVALYRLTLSPLIGPRCRHLPSCSEYADEAIGRFGLWASYATLALLCAVHWLVVRANAAKPAQLELAPLIGLVSLYLLTLFVAMTIVLARFLRAP